jgi:hypothetical protein
MVNVITRPPTENSESGASCCHHWVINEPAGAVSDARCKRCGARREFFNVFEDVIRQENRPGAPAA